NPLCDLKDASPIIKKFEALLKGVGAAAKVIKDGQYRKYSSIKLSTNRSNKQNANRERKLK
ncbi:MAG: hypothetical protein ABIQ44_04010, partial [Chloroflexia bacterium]